MAEREEPVGDIDRIRAWHNRTVTVVDAGCLLLVTVVIWAPLWVHFVVFPLARWVSRG